MKQAIDRSWRGLLLLGIGTVIAVGSIAVVSGPAVAAKPGPLCGPTSVWDCTLRNGSHVTVAGTVCEIGAYEKKKKATCVRSQ